MKFNDKELAAWAMVFDADKEGLLEKKGATRGQGYKQRWFRLKGNLLFYFKLHSDLPSGGGWESSGEPVGVIVLERCHVERVQHDSRPYTFALAFENDDSRTYILSAGSQSDLDSWITAIRMASYEGLKATYYQLQEKLSGLSRKSDSLKDTTVGIDQCLSPKKFKDTRRSAYLSVPNEGRARRLVTPSSCEAESPKYELSLSCTQLPLTDSHSPPSTLVRTRCFADGHTSALAILPTTEIVKSSCSPVYTHLILLEVTSSCLQSGLLVFEVFHVPPDVEQSVSPSSPGDTGNLIGKAQCMMNAVISSDRPLKLQLCMDRIVCGFLFVKSVKLQNVMTSSPMVSRRNALVPLDKGCPAGMLPNIMRMSVRRHFLFSANNGRQLKVIEEMAESVFNIQVPIELLKCYQIEDNRLVEELCNVGALNDHWLELVQNYKAMLFLSIAEHQHAIAHLEVVRDSLGFKSSVRRKDGNLVYVPTNLHIQRMRVQSNEPEKIYNTVTLGCPAQHCEGFKNGGLKRQLWECRSNPSFISRWSEGNATEVQRAMLQLSDIQSSTYTFNNKLYMACANALPQDMNDAMIGISSQVQQLQQKMQQPVVMDAIEALIRARPPTEEGDGRGNSKEEGEGDVRKKEEAEVRQREEGNVKWKEEGEGVIIRRKVTRKLSKQMNVRRSLHSSSGVGERSSDEESPPPPSPSLFSISRLMEPKCSCGKCSRCVPSPSDWIWNGRKYVQVSTREWQLDDSLESIQCSLVTLIDAVEDATTKVVQQQHEAAAAAVRYKVTTYKPSYVWSLELVPLFSQLRQTLDGLFKVAMSSLAFKLVELDSYVEGLQALRKRRDAVFTQTLTAVVTSFYLTLSENYTNKVFLQQIREIGFLVHFESLLSTYGGESGMLEDMCVAVAELGTVCFQLGTVRGDSDVRFDFHITGTRSSLKVQFLFAKEYLAVLPDVGLQSGHLITVVPVLFTQGVNEKQSFTNKHDQQLQEDINLQNTDLLTMYIHKYEKMMNSLDTAEASFELEKVKDLSASVQKQLGLHRAKNVEFLLFLEQLCRRLKGGCLTCCKSGKDRTSMAVTLVECMYLRCKHHLTSSAFNTTLNTLRTQGTRLENCLKNTGRRCYSFNSLQLVALPKLLTPPRHTCREHTYIVTKL